MRCVHEASLHEKNCFLTLTFNDEHLPGNGSLDVKYFQDFMKRLRFRYGSGVRYYHCGEYGEQFGRPHYHACLFNFDFDDKVPWTKIQDNQLWTSKALDSLWEFGFSSIGSLTFESAAYVARYVTKKITGSSARDHYAGRNPEYATGSKRPAIGAEWLKKYLRDVYPSDEVIMRGRSMRPPKYYDVLLERLFPDEYFGLKARRKGDAARAEEARIHEPSIEFLPDGRVRAHVSRLAVREECHGQRAQLLKRSFDSEA